MESKFEVVRYITAKYLLLCDLPLHSSKCIFLINTSCELYWNLASYFRVSTFAILLKQPFCTPRVWDIF